MEEPEEVKKEDDLFDDISKSFQNILEQEKRENEQGKNSQFLAKLMNSACDGKCEKKEE